MFRDSPLIWIRVDLSVKTRLESKKSMHPNIFMFWWGVQSYVFCYTATLPAYCHSVAYISYICYFEVAIANIKRHLKEAGFRQQLLFEMTLPMLHGSVFPRRRYVEDYMKVICGREDLVYIPPWRVDIASPFWNGPWSIHGRPCNTGDTFCSLMSPGSA
jgi:hypothetical protein